MPEPVPVGLAVGVREPVGLVVALPLSDGEPVPEGLAPFERVGVGDVLTVGLMLTDVEGVPDAVPVTVPVGLAVEVPVPVALTVALPLSDVVLVVEGDASRDRVGVGDALTEVL